MELKIPNFTEEILCLIFVLHWLTNDRKEKAQHAKVVIQAAEI